jgi:hypothetical protein
LELRKAEVRSRTIVPFPDKHPDFSIELRKVPGPEAARLRDQVGLNGRNGGQNVREEKYLKALAFASIVRVNGATTGGGAPVDGESDDARELVYGVVVEADGEMRNLWAYCMELYAEQEKAELKN